MTTKPRSVNAFSSVAFGAYRDLCSACMPTTVVGRGGHPCASTHLSTIRINIEPLTFRADLTARVCIQLAGVDVPSLAARSDRFFCAGGAASHPWLVIALCACLACVNTYLRFVNPKIGEAIQPAREPQRTSAPARRQPAGV
jgi:hypothetical protein